MACKITIEDNPILEEKRLKVENGDVVVLPLHLNKEEAINIPDIYNLEGFYVARGVTILYVTNGEIFITPHTQKAVKLLKDAGFQPRGIYFPLSGKSAYPKRCKEAWKALQEKAKFEMWNVSSKRPVNWSFLL